MDKINPEEKVCYNCKYLAWSIGIGQGLICTNHKKETKYEKITNKQHTCELFEINEKLIKKDE